MKVGAEEERYCPWPGYSLRSSRDRLGKSGKVSKNRIKVSIHTRTWTDTHGHSLHIQKEWFCLGSPFSFSDGKTIFSLSATRQSWLVQSNLGENTYSKKCALSIARTLLLRVSHSHIAIHLISHFSFLCRHHYNARCHPLSIEYNHQQNKAKAPLLPLPLPLPLPHLQSRLVKTRQSMSIDRHSQPGTIPLSSREAR